MASKI